MKTIASPEPLCALNWPSFSLSVHRGFTQKLTGRSEPDRLVSYGETMSSHEELRTIALAEFATAGYSATPLARIAELAGLSKSSVLYHYASKEALLEAAIGPAIDELTAILDSVSLPEAEATNATAGLTEENRGRFIVAFVDFLLARTHEVNLFINQGPSLVDVPVADRANALVLRLGAYFIASADSTESRMRFGIALGGAAYTLVTQQTFNFAPSSPTDEIRAALITIVSELLAPIPLRPSIS
jgi:AcrR family transcriptional regulator